jgi:Trm5-related predicted tRNA methylase
LVYLTPDADDVIEDIYPNKVYVVGAIVDAVEIKNLSLKRARLYGIETRRFPIVKGHNYI